MRALDFLTAVWPVQGLYCIAQPNKQGFGYRHAVFDTIPDAAAYVDEMADVSDIFFCIHTLKDRRVWNATAKSVSGKVGKWEVRVQTNTSECKAFFFDLDVGESTERVAKYATQVEALAGLKAFCERTKLPRPAVVSSGGGLHVYWVLDEALPSDEWKKIATRLKKLAQHCELLIDVMRTTDNSSVLRVAGTFNLKKGGKRPVKVLLPITPLSAERFTNKLDAALVAENVIVGSIPASSFGLPLPNMESFGFENNIAPVFADVEPVTIKALAHSCEQVRNLLLTTAHHSEPEWYNLLNLVRFVEDPQRYTHAASKAHRDYDAAAVDAKVDQLTRKGVGPTSCARLADLCGVDVCQRCPHFNLVKSPIVAARHDEQADAPVVRTQVDDNVVELMIPEPPEPYRRRKNGTIAMRVITNEDKVQFITILHHDLYPVKRLVNHVLETEQQVWKTTLPMFGEREFTLDSDALYDRRKFAGAIANRGIYPASVNVQGLQDYMIAYIAKLQQEAEAETQHNHLGWTDEVQGFIMPDKMYRADGTTRSVALTVHAQRGAAELRTKGSLAEQIKLMDMFDKPRHFATQFVILCSLASPIFFKTSHHGSVISLTGKSGGGKSTSMYAAASMWGHPENYCLNGTEAGATPRFRQERVTTLSNLPVCVDEITHIKPEDARTLAMSATQGQNRGRLERDGTEKAANKNLRANFMIVTSNVSVHSLLASNNAAGDAGSMRVIEFNCPKLPESEKPLGDQFLYGLMANFGHIGPRVLQYYVTRVEEIGERIRELIREIDKRAKIAPPERFWSATMAAACVAGEIAYDLGLLPYSTENLLDWLCDVQVPQWRGILTDEYASPLAVVADYLETINDNILVAERHKDQPTAPPFILKEARGRLLARIDKTEKTLWISRTEFWHYCARIGANPRLIVDELNLKTGAGRHDRIVPHKKLRKTLGAGTDLAKAQVWCFGMDLAHPEVSGMADVEMVSNAPTVKITKPTGKLRVVEDDA